MLDFACALYLGMRHPTPVLRPWNRLTSGTPALLNALPGSDKVAGDLAELIGCEAAVLLPSTLHLFWDLFNALSGLSVAVYVDSASYPIAKWGVEPAATRGVPVSYFAHHQSKALRRLLRRDAPKGLIPVVVTDGFYPERGHFAPLKHYLKAIRDYGGYLVLDDTQALGVFGEVSDTRKSYGCGGGGSLKWSGLGGPDVVVAASLAKGFGVPVAVLAGSDEFVRTFNRLSETQAHCSPPSAADIHAAEHALAVNREQGDHLRNTLYQLVRQFRKGLAQIGQDSIGSVFPFQTIEPVPGISANVLHKRLLQYGVRTVLHGSDQTHQASVSFVINASHKRTEIGYAIKALSQAMAETSIGLE